MQKRAVVVSAAALGLAPTVQGCVAGNKSKGFVVSSESLYGQQHCVYPRNPGFRCGVAGALLALTAVALATVASCGDVDGRDAPATGGRRADELADRCLIAWVVVLIATVLFLYGAAKKRSHSSSCTELKSGIFNVASVLSFFATGFAIEAYLFSFVPTDEPAPDVEMGQPQWAQPYPAPPVANPAPPRYEHDGNGARQQPAGTT